MFLFFSKIYDLINYYIELSKIYSATTVGDTVILTLQDNYGKVRQWTSSIYKKTSPDGTNSTEMTSFNPAHKKYGAAFNLDEHQKLPTRSKDEKKRAIFLSPGETTFDQFGRKYICKDISRKGFSDNDNLLQRLKNNDCFVEVVDQFSEVLKILDQEGNTVAVNTNPKPPIEHGPFAKWDMPIYQDSQERYWAKICCETMELQKPEGLNQDLNQQVENKSEDPKNNVLRSFTESAWAVFDKAGEFLFEQHEDGTIDYPATAVSFGLMALQMYYSGGLGAILSRAGKDPAYIKITKRIILSSLSTLSGFAKHIPAYLKSSLDFILNNKKKILVGAISLVISIGNDFSAIKSFYELATWLPSLIQRKSQTGENFIKEHPPDKFGIFKKFSDSPQTVYICEKKLFWILDSAKSCWNVYTHPSDKPIMSVSFSGVTNWGNHAL